MPPTARAGQSSPRHSLADLAGLIAWSALMAGAGELLLRLVARQFLPEPVFIDPASTWLGPLSALIVFAPVILAGWLVGRRFGPAAAWGTAFWLAIFLAVLDVLLLVPRLHPLALAVLAAGVAASASRIAGRWPAHVHQLRRVSTAVLLVGVGIGAGLTARRAGGPRSGAAGAAGDRPNILLLVLDTVRALELSVYGYVRPTSPGLDAIARESVQFDRAVANAPWTLPTHAALFTGRFQRDLSVGWSTPLDDSAPTLAESLRSLGYETGGFVANLRYCSHEYGLARGFETYRDYSFVPSLLVGSTMLGRRLLVFLNAWRGTYVQSGRKDARLVVDEFLDWERQLDGAPYFAFLNLFDAHDPYAPEAPFDLMFGPGEPVTRRVDPSREYTPEEVQGLRDAYDGAIASLDDQLQRLFAELERRGTLDQTLVVVTADHGEEFAIHDHLGHGNGLHFPALHVPLLLRWPDGGIPEGVHVPEAVSLVDVPATILDLINADSTASLPGSSLAPYWEGGTPVAPSPILSELYWVPGQPDRYPVSAGNMHSLVLGDYHLIAGPDANLELYNIMRDPFERENLVDAPEQAERLAEMRARLAAFPMADRGGR